MQHSFASHAYLPAAHGRDRDPLNGSRIAAYTLVAVIHLAALGLLARTGADVPLPRFIDESSRQSVFADAASHRVLPSARDVPVASGSATASASAHRDRVERTSHAPAPVVAESSPAPNTPGRAEQIPTGDPGTADIANDGANGAGIATDNGGAPGSGTGVGAPVLRKLRPIRTPAPEYPPHALNFSEEGVVVLLLRIGLNGRPLEATVVKSSGFDDLDRAMRKQVLSEWRFAPAMENGKPIEAFTLAKQRFVLNDPM